MADMKPTPTQAENDLAAQGQTVMNKEPDGSAPELSPHEQTEMKTRAMQPEPQQATAGYQTRMARPSPRPATPSKSASE